MNHISVAPLVTAKVKGNLSDLPARNDAGRPRAVAFCKRSRAPGLMSRMQSSSRMSAPSPRV